MKKLTISEVGSLIAVSIPTLRRWDRGGFLTLDFLTTGCHKRYSLDKVKSFRELGAVEASPEAEKPVVLYSRVSSSYGKSAFTKLYGQETLWSPSYFISSVGAVPLEVFKTII